MISNASWLTPRRLRAQATVLALCLWVVCIVDFSAPGMLDRAGNVKFQDFLPLYVAARQIAQGRASDLYDQLTAQAEMRSIVGESTRIRLPNLYGPQVGLLFAPFTRFPFATAARIWVALSLLVYLGCIYIVWKSCPALRSHFGIVAVSALAFPPLFHFFVRGQISVPVLACFTAAYLALRSNRAFLAGIALGFLVFKPQFLVAIPLVLMLAYAWKVMAGLVLAAAAQLALTEIYFGAPVMRAYCDTLQHPARWISGAELSLAPIQMHSLRSFWSLLIPWPEPALALYALSSIVIISMAALVWKSSAPLALRFSALILGAVLVNPHLFVYDLLVLAPVLLVLVEWTLVRAPSESSVVFRLLLYLAFLLPLFGPLSRWTHVQLSVPVFVALVWMLWRHSAIPSPALASNESGIV